MAELEVKLSVEQQQFENELKVARRLARDTGKEIDQDLFVSISLETQQLEDRIKDIKQQLKQDLPPEVRSQLRFDLAEAKSDLTETRRRLQNLRNT